MKKILFFLFVSFEVFSQSDTTILLEDAIVRGFETQRSILNTSAAVSNIKLREIERFGNTNLTQVFNAQTGVRMEERSPGSYRLAIRGSSLRSPFGVRNVKVYLNGMPISDANGITYFNQLDMNSLGEIEVLKGPSGSMFGAGIGGVVSLKSKTALAGNSLQFSSLVGSYQTFNNTLQYSLGTKKSNTFINFSQAHSDGYREHSASKRIGFNLLSSIFLKNHTLSLFGMFSDLAYETPGGLTFEQMQNNRKAARPAAGAIRGSIEQKASINQNIFFGGISDEWSLKNNFKLNSAVVYANSYLENPFVNNFEKRPENSISGRLVLSKKVQNHHFIMGVEAISSQSVFSVFDNDRGTAVNKRYDDEVSSFQSSFFFQYDYALLESLFLTLGASLNNQNIDFRRVYANPNLANLQINDKPVVPFSPRVALLYKINTLWSVFGSISNGFSSPTIQEFTNTIQFASNQRLLKAENGQNFELGSKISFAGGRAFLEATVYSLNLKNGLVRRLNENGNEFFDNSGLIIQNGLETSLKYALVKKNTSHFISATDLRLNYTYNDFRYKRFETPNANFQNNKMPGVPQNNLFFTLDLQQKNGIFVNLDVNYLSSIPLNDANTFAADAAIMTNARAGFEKDLGKFPIKFFVGINNILNQEYSFGYDFNAFGNRFYNPAPLRNYNAGITIGLNSSK